jgi:hypothetical protein
MEMSGKRISAVLRYGVNDKGGFEIEKSIVWPMLRTIPNNTRGSLNRRLKWNPLECITLNGRSPSDEKVNSISIKGNLEVNSNFNCGPYGKVDIRRRFFPSAELPVFIESYLVKNIGSREVTVEIPECRIVNKTDKSKGVDGVYSIISEITGSGTYSILPGDSVVFAAYTAGYDKDQIMRNPDCGKEYEKRMVLVNTWMHDLSFTCPDSAITRMFAFSKIRACESIFWTKAGPLHSPGGETYYAAIWANDEAEYVNPFFPYTGYAYADSAALNSYLLFARYMNKDWKPIPSSIIAEGEDIWDGAGDRGDAAMIAYGASRYALARGSREEAQKLFPLIKWCLEYCRRQLNSCGVVKSDCDELEHRFPAGRANLCTSSLYYDALLSAAYLNESMNGKHSVSESYMKRARLMKKNIENYFGDKIEGYNTYRYYEGNELLRSWICIPLVMGINDRAEGTVEALFSSKLWTENGLLIRSDGKTFWDRETLYALRGAYAAGAVEKATAFLKKYSYKRLLGEHVPYAIEAWPEGGQRHLSAESGLYARIITEGIFGIRPAGLRSFELLPRLPEEWDNMSLERIFAFGSEFSIYVKRICNGKINLTVKDKNGKILYNENLKEGEKIKLNI